MATVNFSIPEEVKAAFNAAFEGQNKSAIIARLMMEAVEEVATQERRRRAMRRLHALRNRATPVSADEIATARKALRK